MLKAPRAIVFDWDETLVESWGTIHKAVNETRQHFGLSTWTLEESHQKIRLSMRDTFPAMFGDQWHEAAQFWKTYIATHHLETLVPKSGAVQLLSYLKDKNIHCGIVSNKTGPILRREVEHLKWDDYFPIDFICGAEDGPTDKPHLDCWTPIRDNFAHFNGKDIWYAGDAATDMDFANNIGATAIFVNPKSIEKAEGREVNAHVSDCHSLLKLIKTCLD